MCLLLAIAHCSYTKLGDGWAVLTCNFLSSTLETQEKTYKQLGSAAKKKNIYI